jgi:hypothetical protein
MEVTMRSNIVFNELESSTKHAPQPPQYGAFANMKKHLSHATISTSEEVLIRDLQAAIELRHFGKKQYPKSVTCCMDGQRTTDRSDNMAASGAAGKLESMGSYPF